MKLSQKLASITIIILFAAFLIALLLRPTLSHTLSITIFIFAIGAAILYTVYSNWENKKHIELTNAQFTRNTALDLIGLVLTMGTAIWLGRLAGYYAGQIWGLIAGIIVAMAVGLISAFLVGRIWNQISQPLRVSAK